MKQPLELRKIRDFGQIINDSFVFLRANFKPLFTALAVICGIFILIGTVTSVYQYLNMMGLYKGSLTFDNNRYDVPSYTASYLLSVLFNAVVMMLLQSCIHLVTLCYISVYVQKGNAQPTFIEVWGYFKYYFWRVFGASLIVVVLVVIGFCLCLIPGIYLLNVFYLIIPIIVIENTSFSYSFNKSFQLIKQNWWFVFGVIFIMSLIVGVAGSIANAPLTIFTVGASFFSGKSYTLPILIILSILRNVLMLLYTLPAIAIALCYFNLSEQKDGTGLLSRIENFGKSIDDNPALPLEEY
jgi:uncharacterized membrane protein YjjP (DUF1212 family)